LLAQEANKFPNQTMNFSAAVRENIQASKQGPDLGPNVGTPFEGMAQTMADLMAYPDYTNRKFGGTQFI
jgi:hypothetical protein